MYYTGKATLLYLLLWVRLCSVPLGVVKLFSATVAAGQALFLYMMEATTPIHFTYLDITRIHIHSAVLDSCAVGYSA
jgi:hypothetical protein